MNFKLPKLESPMVMEVDTVVRLGLNNGNYKFHKEHSRFTGSMWTYPDQMYQPQDMITDKNGGKSVLVNVPAGVVLKVKRLNIRKQNVNKSIAIAIHKTYNKTTRWDYPSVEFLLSVDEFEALNLEYL